MIYSIMSARSTSSIVTKGISLRNRKLGEMTHIAMSELEKMQSQMLYDANDPELAAMRKAAQDLCYEYNALRPSDIKTQRLIMNKLLKRVASHYEIRAPFWCDYGFNIEIGENFFSNFNLIIIDCGRVIFGDNVMIGPDCCISSAGHPLDSGRRNAGLEYAYTTIIEDNVWLGSGVHVMPGVSIGAGSVIGSGSIVTKDIPKNSLAFGNPCRVIRKITKEEELRNWAR